MHIPFARSVLDDDGEWHTNGVAGEPLVGKRRAAVLRHNVGAVRHDVWVVMQYNAGAVRHDAWAETQPDGEAVRSAGVSYSYVPYCDHWGQPEPMCWREGQQPAGRPMKRYDISCDAPVVRIHEFPAKHGSWMNGNDNTYSD